MMSGLAFFSSCEMFQRAGQIKTPSGTVIGVPEAGKPATLNSDTKVDTITLPAGTNVTTVKESALASIPATDTTPAQPARPARETTTFTLWKDAKWEKTQTEVAASTGTIDTDVAKHKIDTQAAQPLLYAALASLVAAGFFVYRAYPTPAIICGGASVVFFLAWKASGLPDYFWAIGAIALAAAAFLYIGHNRGLTENENAKAH